jgi:hypothetical protein
MKVTGLLERISWFALEPLAMLFNSNHYILSRVSKHYLQQPLRRNLWKLIIGNSLTFLPLEILIGQTQLVKVTVWIIMTL